MEDDVLQGVIEYIFFFFGKTGLVVGLLLWKIVKRLEKKSL